MKEEITLAATARSETGSSAVNRLRKQGRLPGVIYGQDAPKNVSFDTATFLAMQRHHTSENVMLSLNIEGDRAHKVLVREVQHHPLTGLPTHVDFYEVSMTKRVAVAIPLEVTGTPIGVSRDGGILEQLVREIEVECLPDDILEQVDLDVSALEIGASLTVEDIPLDAEKYEKITAPEIAVVAIFAPRVDDAAAEGEAADAAQQPEVIGAADEQDEKDD